MVANEKQMRIFCHEVVPFEFVVYTVTRAVKQILGFVDVSSFEFR